MGPRNHVLDGGPQTLRDVVMVTNFWLLMGYNFGCIIASDSLFDSRDGFSGSTGEYHCTVHGLIGDSSH